MGDFRQFAEQMRDGLVVFCDGVVLYVNPALARMFGYKPAELVGHPVRPLTEQHGIPPEAFTPSRGATEALKEYLCVSRTGASIPVEAEPAQPVAFKGSKALYFTVRDITARRRLQKEVLAASSAERERLARDLHDGIGQELAATRFKVRALEMTLQERLPDEAPAAAELLQALTDMHQSFRGLTHTMAPAAENQSLPILLQKLARTTRQLFGIDCICNAEVDLCLGPEAGLNLQRIAQEAVHNAVRHGQAKRIEISWGVDGTTATLSVADDGSGIGDRNGSGIGVRGMEFRAQAVGGAFCIGCRPEGGTIVTCRLPHPFLPALLASGVKTSEIGVATR